MPSLATFRLLGFPVHIRSGFAFFLVLIVLVNPSDLGVWMALFVAVFTLLHELGHAVAARRTGATAEIALDFMAGYASFSPSRPLTRRERAGISFAGPATQIVIGTITYLLVHGELSWPSAGDDVQIAVLWAGPMIGAFNLIPVLPFDGGHILEQFVSLFAPARARTLMVWFTITVMGALLLSTVVVEDLRPFIIFMVIPLLSVVQLRGAERAVARRSDSRVTLARAEALAWATGDVAGFPSGAVPSPWFRAHQQYTHGHVDVARAILLAELAHDGDGTWWPPDAAPTAALAPLVDLLPRPLPVGGPTSTYVLSGILLRLGRHEDAAHYAATAHRVARRPMMAIHVARAAAALGDRSTAIGWLRSATDDASPAAVAAAVDTAPELAALREDPEVRRILGRA